MKNLIIILFLIPFWANCVITAQIDFSEPDKQAHLAVGFISSGIINIECYQLIKDTDLKPFWSKAISFGVGAGGGILLGHLKEKYDQKHGGVYNKKDFKATLIGAISGSFTVRLLLWNNIPESHVPIEDIWLLENEFIN